MQEDETFELPQFPNLLGAIMNMGQDEPEPERELDADGLVEMPLLPLRGTVIYPNMVTPLFVGRDKSMAALQAAVANGETMLAVAQKDDEVGDPSMDDMYTFGTEISIGRTLRLPDNSQSVLCQGNQRMEIVECVQWEPYIRVRVRPLEEVSDWESETEPLMRAVIDLFEQVVEMSRKIPAEAMTFAINADKPGWLADFVASTLDIPMALRQDLLQETNAMVRLNRVSIMLAQEMELLQAETRIHNRVQQEIDKTQREHFLREQMRAIQGELGEADAFTQEVNELKASIEARSFPADVKAKIDKEMARLGAMNPMSPEMGVIRNYLDWLIEMPWDVRSDDSLDVGKAEDVLNNDHYALDKVKDRILEYIAVKQLAADKMTTPILCFVGPPGTGKTSIGRSIARALDREFVRMSLGGVRDEAEIRGHRRTYIGALPGRVIQSIRKVGSKNPVFMLDEIDKIGQDFRGDPASALLEVLDPEQNDTFRDHFLELDFDLSDVLFITTANALSPIPAPLRDRMEVIEFTSYLDEEKIEIARQFIIPRQLEQHGLLKRRIRFEDSALKMLIRQYTYEAGVRNLEREIANVCRKIARKVAEKGKHPKRVTAKALDALLGAPRFPKELIRRKDEVGIATGVAWTPVGGTTLEIEVNLMPGSGKLVLTGQLGDVMKESAQAALTYTRSNAKTLKIDPAKFKEMDIHLHVPEGAVPKDGPSAGVPLTIALISAFTGKKIRRDVGMTGEITLRGRVLPVGGIREKALAARRVGIKTFIMPEKNHTDLQEIPEKLREDLAFIEVGRIDQVLKHVFANDE